MVPAKISKTQLVATYWPPKVHRRFREFAQCAEGEEIRNFLFKWTIEYEPKSPFFLIMEPEIKNCSSKIWVQKIGMRYQNSTRKSQR